MRRWLWALLVGVACVACDDDGDIGGEGAAPVADAEPTVRDAEVDDFCDEEWPVVSWATFGQGFVRTYCTGCHSAEVVNRRGAPPGVDFDTEAQTLAQAERILARSTGDAPDMPPAGGPPPETLLRLRIWLECGGPTGE